ncbi:unnamed protein product [Pocillopora meandrina]|uniref:Alpha/beta hydrolase fold-3 domain-containing protein n=1 Tax=Pocillopora meandrina TaxID=46732 RepID=A0AAU9WMB7_9CNID|nr:unnamed protein product [Pocillopora meandrina]
MRTFVVCLCVFVVLLANVSNKVYRRLFNVALPDDFPINSTWQFKLVGFSFVLARDLAYIGSFVGLGENYYSNMATVLAFASGLYKNNSYSDVLEINDTEIFGVRVRIYKPVNKTKGSPESKSNEETLLPGVIYFHGGGWAIGSLEGYDDFCRRLAVSAQVIVVSADYRQAPKYTYPIQFNDCYNVAVGLLNTGKDHGVDVTRVMLVGDSSGGNLAAAVSHYLAEVSEMHCRQNYMKAQILIYPALQFLDFNLPSYTTNAVNDILSQEEHVKFVSLYLNGSTDLMEILLSGNHSQHLLGTKYMGFLRKSTPGISWLPQQKTTLPPVVLEALTQSKASPLIAEDFRGVPPTFVITANFDVLRDEGILYVERLQDANIEVQHKNYQSFHGFVTLAAEGGPARTDEGDEAFADIVQYVKDMVSS